MYVCILYMLLCIFLPKKTRSNLTLLPFEMSDRRKSVLPRGNHVYMKSVLNLYIAVQRLIKQSKFINLYCCNIYIVIKNWSRYSLYRGIKLSDTHVYPVFPALNLYECVPNAEIAHVKSILNVHDEMSK